MYIPNSIKIKKSNGGRGLFAKKIIKKGEIIFHFDGQIGDRAHTDAKSLQIDKNKFLESTIKFDNFLNHSCNPNCRIDWQTLNLIALKDIQKNKELSFNYNTSEYNLFEGKNSTFECNCGSKNCIGKIKGFRYLSQDQKKKIKKYISPFLKNTLEQKMSK